MGKTATDKNDNGVTLALVAIRQHGLDNAQTGGTETSTRVPPITATLEQLQPIPVFC
jgi:hypothetical protein